MQRLALLVEGIERRPRERALDAALRVLVVRNLGGRRVGLIGGVGEGAE